MDKYQCCKIKQHETLRMIRTQEIEECALCSECRYYLHKNSAYHRDLKKLINSVGSIADAAEMLDISEKHLQDYIELTDWPETPRDFFLNVDRCFHRYHGVEEAWELGRIAQQNSHKLEAVVNMMGEILQQAQDTGQFSEGIDIVNRIDAHIFDFVRNFLREKKKMSPPSQKPQDGYTRTFDYWHFSGDRFGTLKLHESK